MKIEKILKNSLMPEIKIWGMMLPKEVDESADHRNGTGNRMGKTALLNNCDVCPYRGACDQRAKEELEQYGKVKFSCREYLKKEIEFVIQS